VKIFKDLSKILKGSLKDPHIQRSFAGLCRSSEILEDPKRSSEVFHRRVTLQTAASLPLQGGKLTLTFDNKLSVSLAH